MVSRLAVYVHAVVAWITKTEYCRYNFIFERITQTDIHAIFASDFY